MDDKDKPEPTDLDMIAEYLLPVFEPLYKEASRAHEEEGADFADFIMGAVWMVKHLDQLEKDFDIVLDQHEALVKKLRAKLKEYADV